MAKQSATEGEKRQLPGSYSEMYPSRFIRADMLKNAKVTLTIKNIVGEGLMTEDGGANLEWVASFSERPLEFVVNKTNAFCMYRMWGGDPHSWIGKKITLFPTTVKAFGQVHPCIRVWGSTEIAEDLPITIPQGRKKAIEMTMHRVATKGAPAEVPLATNKPSRIGLDPRILTGLGLLNESAADRFLTDNANMTPADMLAALNRLIDEAA